MANDAHATSFFGYARAYQKAANLLYATDDTTLNAPIYFLYFHSIESGLKAFLRAHNLPIVEKRQRKHHRLTDLYEESRGLGLKAAIDNTADLLTLVSCLDSANQEQGLRYFNMNTFSVPDLSWTRDAVEKLLEDVGPFVTARAAADGITPGKAVKLQFTWGRPQRNG
jgi:hypothetical protein